MKLISILALVWYSVSLFVFCLEAMFTTLPGNSFMERAKHVKWATLTDVVFGLVISLELVSILYK